VKDFIHHHFHRLKKTEKVWLRRTAGVLLVIGGMLGFLPVLGYWMFPLGLALLAVDWAWARRLYRQLRIAWGRRYQWLRQRFVSVPAPVTADPPVSANPGRHRTPGNTTVSPDRKSQARSDAARP
jgi:purine-cytosine permease-like protein